MAGRPANIIDYKSTMESLLMPRYQLLLDNVGIHISNICLGCRKPDVALIKGNLHASKLLDLLDPTLLLNRDLLFLAANSLQRIQNCAAHMATNNGKYGHVKTCLQQLHWLPPVKQRIRFKTLITAYKCIYGEAPKCTSLLTITSIAFREFRMVRLVC